MQVFVNFATSPEINGLFESPFRHRVVLQACFHSEAVFHIASAVGALHDFTARQTTAKSISDHATLAFALQQCNMSVNLLTTSDSGVCPDPDIAIITCILFAVFAALKDDPSSAINHSLQGRRLLRDCEHLANAANRSRLLDTVAVQPAICALEIQAKALQGKYMRKSDTSDDPPLPDASRIHSIDHANWTLHYAYIGLLTACQDCRQSGGSGAFAFLEAQKYHLYKPFLKTWERSFADFLFREASSLERSDMERAKVLKANHIAATILASVGCCKQEEYKPYDNECKAIVEFSASVLDTYALHQGGTLSKSQFPFLSFGLWVSEPLFLVMARCHDPLLRRQAAGLLTGQPRRDGRLHVELDSSQIQKPRDTDSWDIEQWIDFTTHTRVDTGMVTYFANLPSKYVETPFLYQ